MSGEQILSDTGHMAKIGPIRFGQKRRACVVPLVLLAACSGPAIVESSATAVTIRYGAVDGIDEARALAEKICVSHQKTAQLRTTANFGLTDHYAHFNCI